MSEQIPLTGILGLSTPMPAPGTAPPGMATEGAAGFPAFDLIMQSQVSQGAPDGQSLPPGGQLLPQTDQERLALQSDITALDAQADSLPEDALLTVDTAVASTEASPEASEAVAQLVSDSMPAMQPLSDGEQLREGVVLSEQWPGLTPQASVDMQPTEADQLVRDVLANTCDHANYAENSRGSQVNLIQPEGAAKHNLLLPKERIESPVASQEVGRGGAADVSLTVQSASDAGVDLLKPEMTTVAAPQLHASEIKTVMGADSDIATTQSIAPTAVLQAAPEAANPNQPSSEGDVTPQASRDISWQIPDQGDLRETSVVITREDLKNQPADPLAAAIASVAVGKPDSVSGKTSGQPQDMNPLMSPKATHTASLSSAANALQPSQTAQNGSGTTVATSVVNPSSMGAAEGPVIANDEVSVEPELNLPKKPESNSRASAELTSAQGRTEPAMTKVDSPMTSQPTAVTQQATMGEQQPAARMAPGVIPQFTMAGKGQMGSPQWGQALNERIMVMAAQNNQVAEIQLDPPELGSLKIRLQVGQDQVSVNFTSPHASVRDAVEQSLPRLREMMEEQGLQLGDSSVNDQGGESDQESRDEGRRSQFAGDMESGAEAVASQQNNGDGLSLVDYYA